MEKYFCFLLDKNAGEIGGGGLFRKKFANCSFSIKN